MTENTLPRRPPPQLHVPVVQTARLEGTAGRIGPNPDDFCVDEIPLYSASGEGEHWYVRIWKRGRTTREAVMAVARAAGVSPSDIGTAGMKDKHAVTTQWLSVPTLAERPPAHWQLASDFQVLDATRHSNKLRTGHLRGNRFVIRLIDVAPDGLERGRAIVETLRREGLVNYFGAQRFGSGGRNLEAAVEWLSGDRRASRFHRKLFASVLQSEIFNRAATARVNAGTDRLLAGDVVRLDGSRSVFVVTDPQADGPRLASRDIHLTGPIWGPKARAAAGEPARMEGGAAAFLTDAQQRRLERVVDGTRRDLLVWPEDLEVEADGPGVLRLAFGLPSGAYATQLIRELTRSPFLDPRERGIREAEEGENEE